MAANRIVRVGPIALTATTTTNILNGAVTSMAGSVGITYAQPVIWIKRMHVANITAGVGSFSMWIGGTGGNVAGSQWFAAQTVAANSAYDWTSGPGMQLLSTDFLVGAANALSTLTVEFELEIGF
jgi:hypothetical protein